MTVNRGIGLDGFLINIQFCDGNLIPKPFGDVNFCKGMWMKGSQLM